MASLNLKRQKGQAKSVIISNEFTRNHWLNSRPFCIWAQIGNIQGWANLQTCPPRCHYSSSVVISPSGNPWARAFNTRRMILPLRVFGKLDTTVIFSGLAIGPIS